MMTMSKKMIPNIRFKGFTDDWCLLPAEEIFKTVSDKNHQELPVLSASQDLGMIKRDNVGKIVIHEESNEAMYKKVLPGQFVIHLRSFQGGFAHSSYEGITSPAYTVMTFLDEKKHKDLFWKYVFMTKAFIKSLETVTYGIRDGRSINFADFSTLKLIYPTKKEQVKLSDFFVGFSAEITQFQNKLEKLYSLKRTMLVKMFPQGDALVPEIRLKGFKGSWKIVKLGDISKKVTEKNVDREYQITLTNSAEYGVIDQRDFFDREISNEDNINSYYVVKPDDFVYNPRVSTIAPVGPINRNKTGFTGIMSPLYYVFRIDDVELLYLEYFFKNFSWHSFMYLNGNNGARSDRFSISDKIFSMMPICIPEDTMEQKAIGKYFQTLDKQLSLYEQKLSKLNNLKTSFLQNMFV